MLRKSPVLRLAGNKNGLAQERAAAGEDAFALGRSGGRGTAQTSTVAFVFGPENGAVSEKLVFEAAKKPAGRATRISTSSASPSSPTPALIENCAAAMGIPATYVQATPDLLMGDLLKNMRSSQIFSVCGLPEVEAAQAQGQKQRRVAISRSSCWAWTCSIR